MSVGIIGGTGLYDLPGIERLGEVRVATPFGEPSDVYVHGQLAGRDVHFLARHGRDHRILPSELNHRANIWGFKALGVDAILAVSAVGSLQSALAPRDAIVPDQFFDRTKISERHTFFGKGIVAHIAFAEPVCPVLRAVLAAAARATAAADGGAPRRVQEGGTYVNMEGPAFSTRAESDFHHKLGFDAIGMTALAEAKLAREAEICYATLALVTDYDAWNREHAAVTVEQVVGHLHANAGFARMAVARAVAAIAPDRACSCRTALQHAVLTPHTAVPTETFEALRPILSRLFRDNPIASPERFG
ncbi:MAG: methylthioadenosine phosphorylase [Verrucomicrobia bacterium A1]|nr:MAG: methylthioadenosine phosphorylase [Verrucomicrobia bacterium A1]